MTGNPSPYYTDGDVTLYLGDSLAVLSEMPDESVDCIVSSPPYYGLRDYGTPGQYGLEATPAEYVENLRALFGEARRVLAVDGTFWLNLGDSYAAAAPGPRTSNGLQGRTQAATTPEGFGDKSRTGLPLKSLLGIPWRTALALQDDGWILRNEIIWYKPNAMPESVRDRLSNRHEHLFMFSKSSRYWFDLDPIREPTAPRGSADEGTLFDVAQQRGKCRPTTTKHGQQGASPPGGGAQTVNVRAGRPTHRRGRNPGDVWSINTRPSGGTHFAVFPSALPSRCITAGCRPGGIVLDPFSGSATTGAAARQLGRRYIGVDVNAGYHDLAISRFTQAVLPLGEQRADGEERAALHDGTA